MQNLLTKTSEGSRFVSVGSKFTIQSRTRQGLIRYAFSITIIEEVTPNVGFLLVCFRPVHFVSSMLARR